MAGKRKPRKPSKRQRDAWSRELVRLLDEAPDDYEIPRAVEDAVEYMARKIRNPRTSEVERRHLLGALEWLGVTILDTKPTTGPPRATYDSARVRGSLRYTDDDRWLGMRESGASSLNAYGAWAKAQKQHGATLSNGNPIPSWKSIEREFLKQAKPGETAWQAAERLGRKAGKL